MAVEVRDDAAQKERARDRHGGQHRWRDGHRHDEGEDVRAGEEHEGARVICQGSCPVTQAAFFSFLSSCLTGLSHTVAGRSQFRVVPRQRPGLAALAFS